MKIVIFSSSAFESTSRLMPDATLSLQRCYLPRRKIFVELIPPHFLEAVAIIATALHDDSVSAQMLPTMDARLGNDLYGWPWRCRRCRRRGRHRQRTRITEAALLIERPNLPFRIDVAGPTWNRRAARPPLPENFSVVIDVSTGKRLTEIRRRALSPRQLHGVPHLSSASVH
jgi:hypothetical protein